MFIWLILFGLSDSRNAVLLPFDNLHPVDPEVHRYQANLRMSHDEHGRNYGEAIVVEDDNAAKFRALVPYRMSARIASATRSAKRFT